MHTGSPIIKGVFQRAPASQTNQNMSKSHKMSLSPLDKAGDKQLIFKILKC